MKLTEYEYVGTIEFVINNDEIINIDQNGVKYVVIQLDNAEKSRIILTYHNLVNALQTGEDKIVNVTYETINDSSFYLCKRITDLTVMDEYVDII